MGKLSFPNYGTGEGSWALSLRQGSVLATIPTSAGSEIRLVRLPDGLLALASLSNGLTIGSINDLAALGQAITAVAKALGPEGGCNG